jgi:hypothetical protein
MGNLLEDMMRGVYERRLLAIRNATNCRVYQLAPPPPKKDTDFILRKPKAVFVELGILEHGVSPASLRLKLWKLQLRVMQRLCQEWGTQYLPVPSGAESPDGFLKPEYYAPDETHANASYGELVLRQLEQVATNGELVRESA